MPNPTADSWSIVLGNPNKLTLHAGLNNYTFPLAAQCPLPVMQSDIAALQTHADQGIKDAVAKVLAALPAAGPGTPTPAPTPTPTPTPAPTTSFQQGWTDLTLSPSDNIGAAVAVAGKGFRLKLNPGRYTQVFDVPPGLDGWEIAGTSAAEVVLDGQGGLTVAQNNSGQGPTRLSWGKGIIHARSGGTVRDLELTAGGSNATDGHDGQAGLYVDLAGTPGKVVAQRVMFRRNQNGFFGNANNVDVEYVVDHCDFVDNSTDGGSHDTYLQGSGSSSVTFIECTSNGAPHGNNFKTRVPTVHMQGGTYRSQGGRWIELADGGTLDVSGGTWIGQDFGQNVFGNGTESTSKGPGNSTLDGVTIYLGNRGANFSNAGTFQASNVKLIPSGGASSVFNDKGGPLTGLPDFSPQQPLPGAPAFVSGAK